MKVTYDVSASDPDRAASGGGTQAPIGMYRAKVTDCKVTKPEGKDRRVEVVYTITNKKDLAPLYDYISLESEAVAWKLDQFLQAMGEASAKKRKGSFDPDTFKGTDVKLKVRGDSYQRNPDEVAEYRAKPGGVWAISEDDDDVPSGEGDDGSGEFEGDDADPLAEVREVDVEEDEAAQAIISDVAEGFGIDPDESDTWQEVVDLIDIAISEQTPDDEAPKEDPEAEPELDERWSEILGLTEEDIDDATQDEITEYAEQYGIDVNEYDEWVGAVEAINDAMNSGDEVDYSSMSLAELKAALTERDLPAGGSKAAMIKKLEAADAAAGGEGPFDE